jgi:transposase, IS5 family
MSGQLGFWDVEERLGALSRRGDPLEKLRATVDFEMFRPALSRAVGLAPWAWAPAPKVAVPPLTWF